MPTKSYEVDPGLDPEKAHIIHPSVTAENSNGTTVKLSTQTHEWVIDEPASKGGADTGPTPLESLLGSLAGCETVVLRLVANAINFKYSSLKAECQGTADLRGARGVRGVRPYFTGVKLVLTLATDEPEKRIELLKRNVELRCPVMNLFSSADVEMDVVWNIVPAS
ncbi:OsmC family protein [Sulfitobacter sp. W074]|uniref:OsmC family protein n=1 Tax=Sulfitobacter sp. W074 TaxID=2867026 RepID=UPI0021A26FEB|nr:OsmC family protein [Sulfitobacter sp. W074]UWR38418.1 OsmC family protein [Sulfitobacter sp. W074]